MASWSKATEQDLSEVTTSAIRMMDEDGQKGLLFAAIRGKLFNKYWIKSMKWYLFIMQNAVVLFTELENQLNVIRNVLQVNRNLIHSKMYGYEGSDVLEVIKNVSFIALLLWVLLSINDTI
jgi:hypothetical protein